MNDIGENIKFYMGKKGFTQVDLAKKIGVSRQQVSHYIKGRNAPSLDVQEKLCEVLGIDMNTLTGKKNASLSGESRLIKNTEPSASEQVELRELARQLKNKETIIEMLTEQNELLKKQLEELKKML